MVTTSGPATSAAPGCVLTAAQLAASTCYPEPGPGGEVAEGGHCIWECGDTTSLHTCTEAGWDEAPPPACLCPALPATSGDLHCSPPLAESGEAEDGTYCILECEEHPALEVSCDMGTWSRRPEEVVCPP